MASAAGEGGGVMPPFLSAGESDGEAFLSRAGGTRVQGSSGIKGVLDGAEAGPLAGVVGATCRGGNVWTMTSLGVRNLALVPSWGFLKGKRVWVAVGNGGTCVT